MTFSFSFAPVALVLKRNEYGTLLVFIVLFITRGVRMVLGLLLAALANGAIARTALESAFSAKN